MVWKYEGRDLAKIVGDFYRSAGRFNGFQHVPSKSVITRLFGPDAWYKAEFKKDGIESKIWEWKNFLAIDNFLDSIEIKFNSERVYYADVWRYDASIHTNQKVCTDTGWVRKVIELTKNYSS